MKIEVLYFQGCPNHKPAVARVRSLMREQGIDATVAEIEIRDAEAAKSERFLGSPSIRVNGLDIDPGARTATGAGFACRFYTDGLPTEDMIRAALREAQEQT